MTRGEILRKGVLKAVEPLIAKAAELAPRSKGGLSGSMVAQSMSYAHPTEAIVRVGPGRPRGSHGILLEYGTIHMTARPFLASAFEATRQEISDQLEIELADILL